MSEDKKRHPSHKYVKAVVSSSSENEITLALTYRKSTSNETMLFQMTPDQAKALADLLTKAVDDTTSPPVSES